MEMTAPARIQQAIAWLSNHVFPLWIKNGIDRQNGSFIESLTVTGEPTAAPRRAMVQARQIYSFTEAVKLKIITAEVATPIIKKSTDFLIANYSIASGAYIYSLNAKNQPEGLQVELYTQAFVLFSLARAYAILDEPEIKAAAQKLLKYLKSERQALHGGFTELKNGKIVYHSNPHMHLFEAAIEWAKVDPAPEWRALAISLFELCTKKFIDPGRGVVAEFFDEAWTSLQEDGKFIFEPGHQYEWAWLMVEFEKATGVITNSIPQKLYELAEKYGRVGASQFVIDEVWSDFLPKKLSSRFWPQCERIKTALSLGLKSPVAQHAAFAKSADEGMKVLFEYLEVPNKGLWRDTRSEAGHFDQLPSKASSLYHIINAISEYQAKRPHLGSLT